MKKFISLFLVFSILGLSGYLSAEKKGAELIVQKKEGKEARGELIAVKQTSLLLLERESGADVSIDIGDVNVIQIMKKSKTLLGASLGFLAGISVGALGGIIGWDLWSWAPQDTKTKYRIVAYVGAIGGLAGALVGGHIGAHTNRPETIKFEGKSDLEIKEILEKLSKKARVKNY